MADTVKDAVEGVVDAVKSATIGESSTSTPGGTAPNLVEDPETGEKVSKTELKKRQKAREVAKKKAEKAAAAPKQATKKADKVDMSDLNPNQYFELRSRQIKHLLDTKKPNPYPHKFHTELDPRTFVEKYSQLKRGEYDQKTELRLGARIMSKRELGSKLRFYVTQSEGVTIQIVAQADHSANPEHFVAEHENLQRGDIIGVVGFPGSAFYPLYNEVWSAAWLTSAPQGPTQAVRRTRTSQVNYPSLLAASSSSHPASANSPPSTSVSRTKKRATASVSST